MDIYSQKAPYKYAVSLRSKDKYTYAEYQNKPNL